MVHKNTFLKKCLGMITPALIVAMSTVTVFAQEADTVDIDEQPPSLVRGTGESFGEDCFDYYTFNSVSLGLSADLDTILAGSPFVVSGTITNENTYPLVDGQVYAKVFRKVTDEEFGAQGNDLVAFFKVEDNVVLAGKKSRALTASWNTPYYATPGDYQMVFFVTTGKRFNHLGLSFTDDIVGYPVDFSVTQDGELRALRASKNNVTLNEEPYYFAAFPPHFPKDDTVTARVVLENPTDEARNAVVLWELSNWDGLRSENILDTVEETITLNPHENRTITYNVDKHTGAVSYLVFKAVSEDTENILNIRFVRDDIAEERLNFPSIVSYPLIKDTENKVFSCVHATNVDRIDNNTLELMLTDSDTGEVIHTYTYTGPVSGAMMATAKAFTPTQTYVNFDLKARLLHEGALVEEVTQSYRCEELDASLCPVEEATNNADSNFLVRGLGAVTVLLLIGGMVFIIRRNRTV